MLKHVNINHVYVLKYMHKHNLFVTKEIKNAINKKKPQHFKHHMKYSNLNKR